MTDAKNDKNSMIQDAAEKKKVNNNVELVEFLREFLGQKIAILCARYQYRGQLSCVGKDFVVLANATSVEISGASANENPQTEDPIQSSIMVKLDAVELISQPNWVNAPLPNEKNYQPTNNR